MSHGRVGLVAQGSRRAGRGDRALLQPFIPLRLSWIRRGELGRVTGVDTASTALELHGNRLLAGYYLNELLLRLMVRDDANPEVFGHYSECLSALVDTPSVARVLRLFEHRLLRSLGFGLPLSFDTVSHQPIDPDMTYEFDIDGGPRVVRSNQGYSGKHLISLREERLDDQESMQVARRLLGDALAIHLGSRRLKSRDVLQDIAARGLEL